jgi:hypothetical protein
MFENVDVISSYTREQALDDGTLVDVSELAKEAGFKIPVAITSNLYHILNKGDFTGRLWDVLTMLRIKAVNSQDNFIKFIVKIGRKNETLWSIISGEGEKGSPVLTIMFPEDY